jgi:mevalonate kinase
VTAVRRHWQADPDAVEAICVAIGELVRAGERALASGDPVALGRLLDQNQGHLAALGVSSLELERLIAAARTAGALGAKLSGGGQGGNMIALVKPEDATTVATALMAAGAAHTWITPLAEEVG